MFKVRPASPRPKIAFNIDHLELDTYKPKSFVGVKILKKDLDEHIKMYLDKAKQEFRAPPYEIEIFINISDRYRGTEEYLNEQDVGIIVCTIKGSIGVRRDRDYVLAHDAIIDSMINKFNLDIFLPIRSLLSMHSFD